MLGIDVPRYKPWRLRLNLNDRYNNNNCRKTNYIQIYTAKQKFY